MRWFACFLVAVSGLIFSTLHAATFSDQAAALAACSAEADFWVSSGPNSGTSFTYSARCYLNPGPTSDKFICKVLRTTILNGNTSGAFCSQGNIASFNSQLGSDWYATDHNLPSCDSSGAYCFTSNSCSTKHEFDSSSLRPPGGLSGNVCYNSCQYETSFWYEGVYPSGKLVWTYTPTGSICSPTDEQPEPVPPDSPEITEPIDPDEPLNLGPDRGGVEKPVDPGPGRDENGYGISSGGGSCDAPPACSGDAIQCNILFQTWSTRCEAQRIADAGGVGGGDGNDPWEGKLGDPGSTDLSPFMSEETVDGSFLDDSGLGLPRSCPDIDTFDLHFFGSVKTIDFGSSFCQGTSWVGSFIVLLGVFVGIMAFFKVR